MMFIFKPFSFYNHKVISHVLINEECTVTNFDEGQKSNSFSNLFNCSLFKLKVRVKLVQFYSHCMILSNTQEYNGKGKRNL